MQKLISGCSQFDIEIPEELESCAKDIMDADVLTPEISQSIIRLWQSDCIKQVMNNHHKILPIPGGISGVTYYVQNAQRLAEEDYEPTSEDVIRAKLRTTGITEMGFQVGNQEYNLIDIGGQRSERRKWLHCFEAVHVIIYMIAINEYDMVLEEDGITNRLQEAFKLFELLTSTHWLRNIPCVLIMNKTDLFKEEIISRPLAEHFPDYTEFLRENCKEVPDSTDIEEHYKLGIEFMKQRCSNYFQGCSLYAIESCAIDKEDCDKVFKIIKREMIEKAICLTGFNQFF